MTKISLTYQTGLIIVPPYISKAPSSNLPGRSPLNWIPKGVKWIDLEAEERLVARARTELDEEQCGADSETGHQQMIITMRKGEKEMDILDAIRKRKSIRGYKPDPVPKAVIREILETAGRAPSAMNNQPWEFVAVTGVPLSKIKAECVEKLNAGEIPQSEYHLVGWTNDSIYRVRQVDLAKHIFQVMNIPREDKVKRAAWLERGFRYFDAPAAIIIFVDKTLTEIGPGMDVGAVMQTICLAALHFGLGTCIHDQGVMYPEVVKRYTGIPESKRLMIAISIGYPDEENVVNTITSTRESLDDHINWIGFP